MAAVGLDTRRLSGETPAAPAEGEAVENEPKADAEDDDSGTVAVEEPLAEEALPAEETVSTEAEPAADDMLTNE